MPISDRDSRFLRVLLSKGLVKPNIFDLVKDADDIISYLINNKIITEEQLLNIYKETFRFVDDGHTVNPNNIDKELLKIFPKDFMLSNKIVPISTTDATITIATYMPFIDENQIKYMTKKQPIIIYTTPSRINRIFEEFLYQDNIIENAINVDIYENQAETYNINIEELAKESNESTVVKLANNILYRSVQLGASDIHIEPREKDITVRYRIDGILKKDMILPNNVKNGLIARFKIMSNLDISEKRRPQDGAIRITINGRKVQLRVSTLPTAFGEKIVMRIQFPEEFSSIKLENLGFEEKDLQKLRETFHKPYGIILVVGPTGSGKTTTLYSILQELNTEEVNIVTAEDPIEINIPGLNQVQIDEKVGRTFEQVLRAFLRQDPDIMLIGEIRDKITAEIAVKSALTGHLVLSTLHVNDAPSTIARLMDMGIEPFLISSSLLAISAQRLVRKLCPNCKIPHTLNKEEKDFYKIKSDVIYQANKSGCEECNHLGYKGRTVIAELIFVDNEIRQAINQRWNTEQLRDLAIKNGMETLFQSGIIKVDKGITSLEEVMRVAISSD